MISKQLVVEILGDATKLSATYDSVTKDSQKFGKEVEKNGMSLQALGTVMMAVGGTIISAMAATVLAVAKQAREIEHSAAVAGTTAEEFERLAAAGKKVDVTSDQIVSGLDKLAKSMNAATKGTGAQAEVFDRFHISVQNSDGTLRKSVDVLKDLADHFKKSTNETQDAADAQVLFGKAGAQLLPLLNLGREGIEKYGDAAAAMGGILSEQAITQLADLDRKMQTATGSIANFGKGIAVDLAPYLIMLVDGLLDVLKWMHQLPDPIRQAITVSTAFAAAALLISGACIVLGPAVWTAMAPFLPFIAAAAALGAVAVLVYNNWNAVSAFLLSVFDKYVAAWQMDWSALKLIVLGYLDVILRGMIAFVGWVPGWGDKLKSALNGIETQMHKETQNIATNAMKWKENTYNDHYKTISEDRRRAANDHRQQESQITADEQSQLDLKLKSQEEAVKKRIAFETEANKKLLEARIKDTQNIDEQTKGKLALLDAEKEAELKKAEELGANKAAIIEAYALKEKEIVREAAEKKADYERQWQLKVIASQEGLTKNLEEQKNLRLKSLEIEKAEAIKKATEQGLDTSNIVLEFNNKKLKIDQDYAENKRKIDVELNRNLITSQDALTKNLEDQKNHKIQLLEIEKAEAIKKATEEGIDTSKILQDYDNRKLKIEQDYAEERRLSDLELKKSLIESQASLTQNLEEQKDYKIQLLEIEKNEAIKKATEEGRSTAEIEQLYANKKLEITKSFEEQKRETERQQEQTLLSLQEQGLEKEATNERLSYAKRADADKQAWALKKKMLTDEKNEAIRIAKEKGESVAKIEEIYAEKSKQLMAEEEEANYQKNLTIGKQITDYLDMMATGQKSLKDILKESLIAQLNSEEAKVIASIWSGIAAAWAQAPFTWGASLSWIPALLSNQGLALAGIEAAKAVIRGLATGGVVAGGSDQIFRLGDGKEDEAVLPLNEGVFNQLAAGIVGQFAKLSNSLAPQPALAGAVSNSNTYNGGTELHLHVGTLIGNKDGYKQLVRDITPIINAEKTRRGE